MSKRVMREVTSRIIAWVAVFSLFLLPIVVGAQDVAIDADDIGGVVSGPSGPEAGVWVIAETKDLGTRFARIVVTDDQGRYVLPDLPDAKYEVWVRGYGLVDSPKVKSAPGKTLNLTAVPAPNEAAAAQYYPAIYWYSMLEIPGPDQFGGKSNIPAKVTQAQWLNYMKNNGCVGCHQLGQLGTRTIPKSLGKFDSSEKAWMRRVQSGQAGGSMTGTLSGLGLQWWTNAVSVESVPYIAEPSRA